MSCSLTSKDDTGAGEERTSLLKVVVRMSRDFICGRWPDSCCLRSVMGVEASTGSDRVEGSPRPGKEVKKTLIVLGPIRAVVWSSECKNVGFSKG